MYDNMRPFLRFINLTVSDFVPSINDEKYHTLKDHSKIKTRLNKPLIDPNASSRKLKTQTKMISIIKNSLKIIQN